MSEETPSEARRKMPRPPKPKLPQEQSDLTLPGQTVATNLSSQLGSDTKVLSEGEYDMRRLSNLDDALIAVISYFSWRGGGQKFISSGGETKTRRGVGFWRHIVESYLNLPISKGGMGRRQLIEMQRASLGVPNQPEPEPPGWLGRNLTQRDWRQRQEE